MRERSSETLERRYEWPDGRFSWRESWVFPTSDGCLAIFFRDVTERNKTVKLLGNNEKRFKAAVAAIEGVLWTNNAIGEMTGEQAAWAALTGQSQAEYQGYGWSRAVHHDDVQPTMEAWQVSVAGRKLFEFKRRVRRHDGQWRMFAVRAIPVKDAVGEITEWVGVHLDITEQRRLMDLLARTAETFTGWSCPILLASM